MRAQYGKTWWGQRFLKSLDDIDYDNRLPRGRSYANRDAVRRIEREGNEIKAAVQGSARKPYQVRILFHPFPEKAVKAFIAELSRHPETVSRLLNKEMDPSLLSLAEANGLKLFPEKWSDLKMQCSCPDWAVPCKHIAAVIYKTSAEIDNHPFMVFELHGVDLLKRLQKKGQMVSSTTVRIPTLKELYNPVKVSNSAADPFPPEPERKSLEIPAFPDLGEALLSLLQPRPVFHPGTADFKETYAAQVDRIATQARRLLSGKIPPEAFLKRGQKADQPLPANQVMRFVLDAENRAEIQCNGTKTPFPVMLAHAFAWESGAMQKRHPSQSLFHAGLFLALQLLAKRAVVPQVVELPSERYKVRWLPAMLHPEVHSVMERLSSDTPKGFVCFQSRDRAVSPPLQASVAFVSGILDLLLGTFETPAVKDLLPQFLFEGKSHAFKGAGEVTVPESVQHWLHRMHASSGPFKVHAMVSERAKDRFELSLLYEDRREELSAPFTTAALFEEKRYDDVRYAVLQSVAQLRGFIPGLDGYLKEKGSVPAILTMEQLPEFLFRMVPAMELMDVRVLLPKSLQNIFKPALTVRIKSKRADAGFLSIDDMLDFDWQVAVGDEMLDEDTFLGIVERAAGLIRLKSGFMYAGKADIEQMRRLLTKSARPTAAELLTIALSERYGEAKVELTAPVRSILKKLTECPETKPPKGLEASLRPYQQRGYSWLWRNSRIGFGSILADDMGLGKTLQVIAAILKFKEEGLLTKEKALVVAPTGLLTNWQAECERFAPSLKVLLYHGPQRELPKKDMPEVLLTSYGVLRSDAEKLRKTKWRLLVIDEAQNIKNTDTAQTKAVKSVTASHFIAMSGTPVENRLTELWSIMDFCNRGLLGSVDRFSERYARPIQQFSDPGAAERLRKVCAPFLMRRMKTDRSIITDLPEKMETDCFARLTAPQAALYRKTLDSAMEAINGIAGNGPRELFTRQGLVLQMMLALKQICNHPTQFLKNGKKDASLSGKTDLLFDRLDGILAAEEKVLVFSQFTEMAGLLSDFIRERYGRDPLYYHGGMGLKERKETIARFQEDPSEAILLLSLKAGGTGLNLTSANHVIHYDLWWNPAVEAQATDRAYRIGQRKDVMVHRFITKDTFEERINDMIRHKKKLADLTVGTGEQWIGQLSNREIEDVFRLG